jgi:hypothetical protein
VIDWPEFENPPCRGLTNLFVARQGRLPDEIDEARAICSTCPHCAPCREFALAHRKQTEGMMWGGLTDSERNAVRRARKRSGVVVAVRRRKEPDHGTSAGYTQHRRLGTVPCQRCKDAFAAAQRDYKARAGA